MHENRTDAVKWCLFLSRGALISFPLLCDSNRLAIRAHSAVLSGPSGRGPALLHPPHLRAVLSGRGHGETGKAQENEEIPKAAILTISLLPVAPL